MAIFILACLCAWFGTRSFNLSESLKDAEEKWMEAEEALSDSTKELAEVDALLQQHGLPSSYACGHLPACGATTTCRMRRVLEATRLFDLGEGLKVVGAIHTACRANNIPVAGHLADMVAAMSRRLEEQAKKT